MSRDFYMKERDQKLLDHVEIYGFITTKQAKNIFYKNYEVARRRLTKMESLGFLNSYILKTNREIVYCFKNKLDKFSYHNVKVMDFYSEFYNNNAKVIGLKREFKLFNGYIRADALFKFEYEGAIDYVLLEVDYTHVTDIKKMKLYEKAYKENIIQEECEGIDPLLVVMRKDKVWEYRPKNFQITYMDMYLTDFKYEILEC